MYALLFLCFPGFAKDRGFIVMAQQSSLTETQACHTVNRPHLYPDVEERRLQDFGSYFNFVNVEDHDALGRNIFVLLFEALKYWWLVADIARHCFGSNSPKMPGDYHKALRQRITTGPLTGKRPINILLHDSDACLMQKDIVKELIDNNYFTVLDFEEMFWTDAYYGWKVFISPPHS